MQWRWRLVNCALGLTLVVVLLGGWTRLNDAGLGCPDWPVCYGHLVLPPAALVDERITPHFPGHEVDLAKGWIEMIHRYAAALLGVILMVQAGVHVRTRSLQRRASTRLALLLVVLVVVQGLFGMWTVTLKLVPWVVTLHLLGGLMTLTLLIRLRQQLCRERASMETVARPATCMRFLLLVLFAQLVLGGWTSSNYAGWACDDWFGCRHNGAVDYDFVSAFDPRMPLGENYQGGSLTLEARSAIQMTHRAGALAVIILFGVTLLRWRAVKELRPWLLLVSVLIVTQVFLGILNVLWFLPVMLAVAHHAVAVLLLMAVLGLYERAKSHEQEVTYACESFV